MSKSALFEAIKLPLRLFVLAFVPFLVAFVAQLPYQWVPVASILLVALDKYLHEVWKEEVKKGETPRTGLVPF